MEDSAVYVAIQSMMQMDMLVIQPTQLAKTLLFFEQQQLITEPERNALLELAEKLTTQTIIH